MKIKLMIFMFLFVGSFSHAQTPPEILRNDVFDGNQEAIQAAINGGAIIDATTRERLWEAVLSFKFGIAYILLDALFEHRIDILNCEIQFTEEQPWGNFGNNNLLPDLIDFMLMAFSDVSRSDRFNLMFIRNIVISQSYEDLSTC